MNQPIAVDDVESVRGDSKRSLDNFPESNLVKGEHKKQLLKNIIYLSKKVLTLRVSVIYQILTLITTLLLM